MCRVWSNLLTSWGRHEDEGGKEDGELQKDRFPWVGTWEGLPQLSGQPGPRLLLYDPHLEPNTSRTPGKGRKTKRGQEMNVAQG